MNICSFFLIPGCEELLKDALSVESLGPRRYETEYVDYYYQVTAADSLWSFLYSSVGVEYCRDFSHCVRGRLLLMVAHGLEKKNMAAIGSREKFWQSQIKSVRYNLTVKVRCSHIAANKIFGGVPLLSGCKAMEPRNVKVKFLQLGYEYTLKL